MLYLMLGLGCAAFQNKLIFPGAATQGAADALVHPRPGVEIVRLKLEDGTPIVAQFSPAIGREPAAAPTVVFFYGNGMCLAYAEDILGMFRELGCNVICPDYPGYGMSGGEPSEAAFYATADAVYTHLQQRTDIDGDKIIPVGLSIGGGAATDLAARQKVAGLILFAPFTSLTDMGRKIAPWLPTSWILKYRFDNQSKIATVKVPTFICHGQADTLIPPTMSKKLIDHAGGAVQSLFIPGAGHNDLFLIGGQQIDDALKEFLKAM